MVRLSLWLLVGLVALGTTACGVNQNPNHGFYDGGTGAIGGTTAGTDSSGGLGGTSSGNGSGAASGIGGDIPIGGTAGDTGGGGASQCTPPTGPYCGDGIVNQATETCDDGNALPGDGCTGVCTVEPYFNCPPSGGACTSTLRCGDGVRSPGEACDDGNNTANDGCAADCSSIDPGYFCPTPGQLCMRSEGACGDSKVQPGETCDDGNTTDGDGCSAQCRVESGFRCTQPGKPCIRVAACGNGTLEGAEACDDGNATSGDGCSSTCHVEIGWVCATPGMPCRKTVCGDGKKEGSECCDDGNTIPMDGCTADCRCEPTCPSVGACTPKCGNGIIEGTEVCDDGNTADGDGCSSTCQPEPGFSCTAPPCTLVNGQCALVVPVTFRDFNAHGAAGGHPDFQPGSDSAGAIQGLVQDMLDADGKPVLSAAANSNSSGGFMHGQSAFAQWYRNDPPSSGPIPSQIILWDNGKGGFVNRWGANGEQWVGYPQGMSGGQTYPNPQQCSNTDCTACGTVPTDLNGVPAPAGSQIVCLDDCVPWGNTQACFAAQASYDGNPLFFPLDSAKGILTEPRQAAGVPEQYGWTGWPLETDVATRLGVRTPIQTATAPFPSATHNFSFTTEVKYWFKYDAKTPATLEFTGDDDVWVFLNGHLAVDLGGWHVPLNGTLSINGATINASTQITYDPNGPGMVTMKNGTATSYGLADGSVYQIQIFHAEREVDGSTFKLTLSGFSMIPSACTETCGDGIVTVSEECDDGANNSDSACGACTSDCKFGPRCGDGKTQTDCGEECDDGVNIGGYNQCDVGCKLGPRCGDGVVQADYGEQCDDGANNGMPGACTANCGVPAFCGDGVVQPPEECDNGVNDNAYGGCSSDCHFGPRCGDGVVQADGGETCDLGDANSDAYGGCTKQCRVGPHCGDGIIQAPEQCDGGDGSMPAMMSMNDVDPACTELNSVCTDTCRIKITQR
jgi:fibro-slime domain-containing protein